MKSTRILALAAGLAISGTALAQKADLDRDGRLSLQEYQASRSSALLGRDSDGDGRVSASEWAAGGFKGAANRPRRDPAKAFARFDSNQDGYLDRSEIGNLVARRFARADVNGDGSLTRDERGGRRSATTAPRD